MIDTALKYDFIPDLDNRSNVHHIEFAMIGSNSLILDVGCHSGILGAALTSRKSAKVIGIDTDTVALDVARTRLFDAINTDVELAGWETALVAKGYSEFDVVIFGDVLEHTRDPLTILLTTKKLLKPEGRIVVSIPNVAHWRIRFGLLRGQFTYSDSGILDRTHLRFFTRTSGRDLLHEAGYRIVESDVAGYRLPHWLIRRFPGLLAIQLVYAATPDNGHIGT